MCLASPHNQHSSHDLSCDLCLHSNVCLLGTSTIKDISKLLLGPVGTTVRVSLQRKMTGDEQTLSPSVVHCSSTKEEDGVTMNIVVDITRKANDLNMELL